MTPQIIQQHLAAALRDEPQPWPEAWSTKGAWARVVEDVLYHGVAGLLIDKPAALKSWPSEVVAPVRRQAIAQAMWELQHRALLSDLLAVLAERGIVPLLLKGTAIAYDLYQSPASRSRGDTDLLVRRAEIPKARAVLEALGYRGDRQCADGFALQECWTLSCDDGALHSLDLHSQVMNSPAFEEVLTVEECSADSIPLPRLAASARGLDRARALIHTCMHRAMHETAPYLVGGRTYYGADRLIWIHDIHLLAKAFSPEDWRRLCALCGNYGAAAVCLDGLRAARRSLATDIPEDVEAELEAAPANEKASSYFRSRQPGRAWQDLAAIRGVQRKLAYLRGRILPSAQFLRAKYDGDARTPLARLYLRRIAEFLRPRPQRDEVQ